MVFQVFNSILTIHVHPDESADHDSIEQLIREIDQVKELEDICSSKNIEILQRISREEYLDSVEKIKKHIKRGDIYELNFCQEFYLDHINLDPFSFFNRLSKISPVPFACFIKSGECSLLSASPERFLKKSGEKIISQPIKGTTRRGQNDEEDKVLSDYLKNHPKERAENIMITDLVRNDLSKTANRGTVKVKELCGIYSYPQVHQMISTIEAIVSAEVHPVDIIRHAFPMGSMTGAPKIRAMELIDLFETTNRGPYSGAAGYFDPEGNFDFNVLIRTAFYNARTGYLSWSAGGAITDQSDPIMEYEECLLKALVIERALTI